MNFVQISCSNRSFLSIFIFQPFKGVNLEGSVAMLPVLAGRLGFEPRYTAPKAVVLPLDDLPSSLYFTTDTHEGKA